MYICTCYAYAYYVGIYAVVICILLYGHPQLLYIYLFNSYTSIYRLQTPREAPVPGGRAAAVPTVGRGEPAAGDEAP